MDYSEKWEVLEELGEGGQGKVYSVRKKLESLDVQNNIIRSIVQFQAASPQKKKEEHFEQFRNAIIKMIELEDPSQQGALKVLHSIENERDPERADIRVQREIQGMELNLHQNLIEIIEVDKNHKWYVSKLYSKGSLAKNRDLFRGDLYSALKAIRPLVEGVSKLHEINFVHRDIKPQNVFIGSDNQLILGDFGLLYFKDDQRTRASGTFENVGSRDWMPGWAMGIRIDEVKPSFDVFSLGKLLWSMVSGMPILQLWYYHKDQFNVEKMFYDSPNIEFANDLFEKCIVEEEEDCLPAAADLLKEIDLVIDKIETGADQLSLDIKRKCRICGIGEYQVMALDNITHVRNYGLNPAGSRTMRIFECNHCGHVQLFSHTGNTPAAWNR